MFNRATKLLDRSKARIYKNKKAPFLGALMCSVEWLWDESIQTACTNGSYVKWNPHYFMSLPPATHDFLNIHEIMHVAYADMARRLFREPDRWNIACDYRINNDLRREGFTNEGFNGFFNPKFHGLSAEQIYDLLPADLPCSPGSRDVEYVNDPMMQQRIINKVVRSCASAGMGGGAGLVPGGVREMLDQWLNPRLPWEVLLQKWCNELQEQDYTWSRPSRRSQDVYLPRRIDVEDGLSHLIWFFDVSGSVSKQEALRGQSEARYVWENMCPPKMTLVQFDTEITKVDVLEAGDEFTSNVIIGRGGTCLRPVRRFIQKHEPTAAVIFSDLDCDPMQKLDPAIPLLWIAVNASRNQWVNQGELIHINE